MSSRAWLDGAGGSHRAHSAPRGLMDTGIFISDDAVTVVGTPMLPNKSLQPTEHSAAAELVRWARDWRSFNI